MMHRESMMLRRRPLTVLAVSLGLMLFLTLPPTAAAEETPPTESETAAATASTDAGALFNTATQAATEAKTVLDKAESSLGTANTDRDSAEREAAAATPEQREAKNTDASKKRAAAGMAAKIHRAAQDSWAQAGKAREFAETAKGRAEEAASGAREAARTARTQATYKSKANTAVTAAANAEEAAETARKAGNEPETTPAERDSLTRAARAAQKDWADKAEEAHRAAKAAREAADAAFIAVSGALREARVTVEMVSAIETAQVAGDPPDAATQKVLSGQAALTELKAKTSGSDGAVKKAETAGASADASVQAAKNVELAAAAAREDSGKAALKARIGGGKLGWRPVALGSEDQVPGERCMRGWETCSAHVQASVTSMWKIREEWRESCSATFAQLERDCVAQRNSCLDLAKASKQRCESLGTSEQKCASRQRRDERACRSKDWQCLPSARNSRRECEEASDKDHARLLKQVERQRKVCAREFHTCTEN